MASGNSPLDQGCGCLIVLIALTLVFGAIIAVPMMLFNDKAEPVPEPEPEKLELNEAKLWITGDDGGTYQGRYILWTPDGEILTGYSFDGAIEPDAVWYPIEELDSFKSDGKKSVISSEDMVIEVDKSGEWDGQLVAALEVNGKVVACETVMNAELDDASISFDADNPEDYEESNICKITLGFS